MTYVVNGIYNSSSCSVDKQTTGTYCEIGCINGFDLEGASSFECTNDGVWVQEGVANYTFNTSCEGI